MGSPSLGSLLITTIIFIAIFLGVFLVIRSIVLWYWKIDDIVRNQHTQNVLLGQQNDLLQQILTKLKS